MEKWKTKNQNQNKARIVGARNTQRRAHRYTSQITMDEMRTRDGEKSPENRIDLNRVESEDSVHYNRRNCASFGRAIADWDIQPPRSPTHALQCESVNLHLYVMHKLIACQFSKLYEWKILQRGTEHRELAGTRVYAIRQLLFGVWPVSVCVRASSAISLISSHACI